MKQQNQAFKSYCVALILSLFFSSCNSGGGGNQANIPGILSYSFGVQKQHLYADFVATTIQIDVGVTMPIPNLKGATLGINPYLPTDGTHTRGTIFQFDVDLTQLNGKNYSLAGLPDGRALPDVEGGMLPRWAFSIKNVDVYLYLADGAFAIFVPLNLSADGYTLPTTISQEFDDDRGNIVGKIYAIPAQGAGTSSGLLVLLPFIGINAPSPTPTTQLN